MITDVSLQYAEALFSLAENTEKQDFYEALVVLTKVIVEDQEVFKVFEHPLLTPDQKKEIIKKTLDNKVSDTFINFLFVVIDHHRINELANITSSYKMLLDNYLNQKEVIVSTKYPLTPNQKTELINTLGNYYHKQIKIVEVLDNDLIGGVKIVVDNEIIDGSILNKLQKIKDSIKY